MAVMLYYLSLVQRGRKEQAVTVHTFQEGLLLGLAQLHPIYNPVRHGFPKLGHRRTQQEWIFSRLMFVPGWSRRFVTGYHLFSDSVRSLPGGQELAGRYEPEAWLEFLDFGQPVIRVLLCVYGSLHMFLNQKKDPGQSFFSCNL